MAHVQVKSAVARCVDPRLTNEGRQLADEFRENQLIDDYSFAGGGANVNETLSAVNVSVNAHGVSQIVLVGHENCAWAKGQGVTSDDGIKDLVRQTEEKVKEKFPNLQVLKKFMKLNGEVEDIK